MTEFNITFKTTNPQILEASLAALAELYGGYRPTIIDPNWTRQPGQPDEPTLIDNPQSRDEFVRESIFMELKDRVVRHSSTKAAAGVNAAAQASLQEAADSVTVGG